MALSLKLCINNPCSQDWNAMKRNAAGRFCGASMETVHDFSNMRDEEIKTFFTHNREPVCGRFKSAQLARIRINIPVYVFEKRLQKWQKYLLIFLICFGNILFSADVVLGNASQTHRTETAPRTIKLKSAVSVKTIGVASSLKLLMWILL